jgi:hypothetical protein
MDVVDDVCDAAVWRRLRDQTTGRQRSFRTARVNDVPEREQKMKKICLKRKEALLSCGRKQVKQYSLLLSPR